MKTDPLMLDTVRLEAALKDWIEPEHVHAARQEILLAFVEYDELAGTGTLREQEKAATEKLQEIADAARRLCRALDALPDRAKYALLDRRNSTRQPDTIDRWLADLRVIREDVLGPLADDAAAALKLLPAGPGRGAPTKARPSPRDALLLRLAAVFRTSGKSIESGGDPPLHEFLHDAAEAVGMVLPDDLARVLRDAEGKSRRI